MKLDIKTGVRITITILFLIISLFIKNYNHSVAITLSLIGYVIISYDIIIKAIKGLFKGQVMDENFLMMIATIGAILLQEYYEAVAVTLLYQIGELFQDYAVNKSRKSISDLMNIKPEKVNLIVDNKTIIVKPEEIKVNDLIIVKPGEKIPLDGIVVDGTSSLDTKSITGESMPKDVKVNDSVVSGCININGTLKIQVTKDYQHSTVKQILELIENATIKKTNTEKFITKFSKYYTPVVVILALLLAFVPPLILDQSFNSWVHKALVFLVISCPCALVISVPLGFFSGVGRASKEGILFKGSTYMENIIKAKTIVFDKTGTLTKGNFKVTKVYTNNIEEKELIETVIKAEHLSNHPIAISINEYYNKQVATNDISNLEEISGHGIKATINNNDVLVGNAKLMEKYNIKYDEQLGGTIVYVAINNEFKGYIQIEDEIKENAEGAIQKIRKTGINNLIMLTGDNEKTADKISNKLGLNHYYASLLPHEKTNIIEQLSKNNKNTIIFVGDGINDAPSLIKADIGIAMGAIGSDAAIEASDIVLMNDNIESIANAINISKKTIRIVKQNIVFSIGVKIIILLFAIFGMANMWEGIFADVGVSIIAIINSMRLLITNKKKI